MSNKPENKPENNPESTPSNNLGGNPESKQEKQDEKQLQHALEGLEERAGEEKQEELVAKNKMGVMPIGPLLVNMSLPIVISMLVQALYNVVDSIFVSRIDQNAEAALAALSMVFPVQNLMIAVAVGTGVGINSLLSRRLGERNVESANRVAGNGLFLTALSWAAFALFGLLGSGLYMRAVASGGADSAVIIEMGTSYMRIVTVGALGMFMSITLERLLQATGRSMYSMYSQLAGALTNILLDPIMIFGLLGFPQMGVAGAAVATVIGQFVSMGIGIWLNLTRNHEIHIKLRGFQPSGKTIKHIYQVGLPSIVMQSIGSVMTFAMNLILVGFGTTPVSVFGIYFKLQSFVFMPVMGFTNGMVPIIAFNYGAKKPERIEKTMRLSIKVAMGIMAAGTLLFWLLPQQLLTLFDASVNMMVIGTAALRIISLGFLLAAVSIIISGVFQALGLGMYSLWMSLIRQLIFLIPIAWLLARWQGLPALWFAFPIAEVACTLCAVWFLRRAWSEKIKPLAAKV